MIRAVAILCLLSSAVAFVPNNRVPLSLATSMAASELPMTTPEEEIEVAAPPTPEPELPPAPPLKAPRLKAKWFPFGNVLAPRVLDGSLLGDVGFDPLGFSKNKNTLLWMREAELKHGRLAMLAAVGWPLSELYHKQIAGVFGLTSILAEGDRAPSLLNGGLSSVYASGILIMSILLGAILEGKAMNNGEVFIGSEKSEGYRPGDFGFDPLGMDSQRNALAEIKNGRLAMIAITAFAFQEAFTGVPVVQETPYLF
jgi:hypothetical protein